MNWLDLLRQQRETVVILERAQCVRQKKGGLGGSSGPDSLRCAPSRHPGVYFALCLSLMVVSLLETIFITFLLHLATIQPPPMPRCLHPLLLHCTSPRKCCPAALWKEDVGLGLTPTHLSGKRSLHCPHSLHWAQLPISLILSPSHFTAESLPSPQDRRSQGNWEGRSWDPERQN